METACTVLRDPAASSGNPGTGRGEPPFLSAESTTPGEADNVANVFCPRNDCTGAVNLSHELGEHQTEPPGPIIEPRDNYELLGELTDLQRPDVQPTYSTNTTGFTSNYVSIHLSNCAPTGRAGQAAELDRGHTSAEKFPGAPRRDLTRNRVKAQIFPALRAGTLQMVQKSPNFSGALRRKTHHHISPHN